MTLGHLEIYKKIALSQVPRIMGLGDREEDSKTFGCFDRYYWHYKILDFANARFQEAALLLALLYFYNFSGNIFYKKEKVKRWLEGCINFWFSIQNRNGSFDEVYPNENSFVATSFSTYAISEAIRITNFSVNEKTQRSLLKAGKWLMNKVNLDVANQVAGSGAALFNLYLLTGEEKFKKGSEEKIDTLLKLQDKSGYFPEYGGFDIGYLSLCLSFLGRYYKTSGDERVVEPSQKAVDFIETMLNEDGSYNCEKSSRRTQYLYPYGLVIFKAEEVLKKHIKGLWLNRIVNPQWMDDRFCLPLTIDYLHSYIEIFNLVSERDDDNI